MQPMLSCRSKLLQKLLYFETIFSFVKLWEWRPNPKLAEWIFGWSTQKVQNHVQMNGPSFELLLKQAITKMRRNCILFWLTTLQRVPFFSRCTPVSRSWGSTKLNKNVWVSSECNLLCQMEIKNNLSVVAMNNYNSVLSCWFKFHPLLMTTILNCFLVIL
jgi:hypothetical protein